ncbi:Glu/Leu/Phe/Val dehydrogenase [Candidatus Woesearchaeota archaeon]|nr:Glu/Leu/Phe/Val dehydrogenase [Candidatus Woesearchaeota archaeon]
MVEFDGFGPEKIIKVYNPKLDVKGVCVIDNSALGPGKGGIRMTETVNEEEVSRLARAMTWKNALAELPFGGAKSGITVDSKKISREKKDEIVKWFSKSLKIVVPSLYVAGPDMYMAEGEMEIFAKANGDIKSCTGKPKHLGGIPHELGSTGFGVYHSTLTALKFLNKDVKKTTIAIEGFGNVGIFAFKFLSEAGARIVAVSDSKGTVYRKEGIDFNELEEVKQETGSVINYKGGKILKNHEIVNIDADILITAAIPDLIKSDDVNKMKFKLIVEGSNIPMSEETERILYKKGVLVIPDIIANAGGVISSYVEYKGGNEKEMFKLVEEKITKNVKHILELSKEEKIDTRDAALRIAKKRVLEKCKICRA